MKKNNKQYIVVIEFKLEFEKGVKREQLPDLTTEILMGANEVFRKNNVDTVEITMKSVNETLKI